MKVEIFTVCDAATSDSGGKLNVLGSFDRINASSVPVTHPLCALAIKMRFERLEEGQKRVRISFMDSDGKAVMPTLDAATQVMFPPDEPSVTACLVLQIQQLKLPNFGDTRSILRSMGGTKLRSRFSCGRCRAGNHSSRRHRGKRFHTRGNVGHRAPGTGDAGAHFPACSASAAFVRLRLMRNPALLAFILFLSIARAFGNGGAWQVGVPSTGNAASSDRKRATEVTIEEENLTIDLHQEFAAVEVRYRMRNTGPKVTQDFFFPVERWTQEDGGEESVEAKPADLEGYRITADTTELKWKNLESGEKGERVASEHGDDFPPARKLWKKTEIPFAAQQTREVTVRYRATYSGMESSVSDDGHGSERVFLYSLSPAATWKGAISKGTVVINVLHPRPEEVAIKQPANRFKKISDTRYEWSFENLEPTLADDLKIVAHPPFDSYSTGYQQQSEAEQQIPREYLLEGERYYLLHGDFELTASSTLPTAGGHSYDAKNLRTMESDMAWVEGVPGDGIGESITLEVNRPLPLDEIRIMPGYRSGENPSLWMKNNRVAELEVTLNGEHTFTAKIPDEKFADLYPIPVRDYAAPVKTVKLVIKAVHRGTAARDTCISSLRLKAKLAEKPVYQPAR